MQKDFQDHPVLNIGDRLGGSVKKTGFSWNFEEYNLVNELNYGVFVNSTISSGRIAAIDCSKAREVAGVHAVLCYLNRPSVPGWENTVQNPGRLNREENFKLFNNDKITYAHQPVALVVANTFAAAVAGAKLVKISYIADHNQERAEHPGTKLVNRKQVKTFDQGISDSHRQPGITIESQYNISLHLNDRSKIHVAIAVKSRNELTGDSSLTALRTLKENIAASFKLKEENVSAHIVSEGNGNDFSRLLPYEMAAILGLKKTGRPIAVLVSSEHLFKTIDCDACTVQNIVLESAIDGAVNTITHEVVLNNSLSDQFISGITESTRSLYACKYLHIVSQLAEPNLPEPLNINESQYAGGCFAIESILDELSYLVNTDPVALRLKNFAAATSGERLLPLTSGSVKECYRMGAANFGWAIRKPAVKSMKSGDLLLGMGMSSGVFATKYFCPVKATFTQDEMLIIQSNVADKKSIEILTWNAARAFHTDISKVHFIAHDSSIPGLPRITNAHSNTTMVHEVYEVIQALKRELILMAVNVKNTPWSNKRIDEFIVEKGILRIKATGAGFSLADILKHQNFTGITETNYSKRDKFPVNSFCAHFVEVAVHQHSGKINVNRVVTAIDAGEISNLKEIGSLVSNLIASELRNLLAEDPHLNNHFLSIPHNQNGTHLPVTLNSPVIEVIFVNQSNVCSNIDGYMEAGDIRLSGLSAGIANAVFHATGQRIRSLPVRLKN